MIGVLNNSRAVHDLPEPGPDDTAHRCHNWFLDDLGHWVATQGDLRCWQHPDAVWVLGNAALQR